MTKVDTPEAIKLLFSPRSVAFIGASADPTKQSGQPARNVVSGGYKGNLFAVNRRGDPIEAIPTSSTIESLPEPVDVAFVTVPAAECADTVGRLGRRGVRIAVLAVGGFAETGSALGSRLAEEVRAAAKDHDVRLIGPVCNGLFNPRAALALGYNAIHQRLLKVGNVALVSHSGALAGPFVSLLERAGGAVSAFVSAGSEIDIGLSDFIAYFADDPNTDVIAVIVDHVGDGKGFLAAVRRARRAGKQIVALKLGNTPLGTAATLAHSSHLAGHKDVYEAIFKREGIRSVPSVETLALTCALLGQGRCRTRGGIVATSSSGGGAIILADLLTQHGVPVSELSASTLADMGRRLRFDAARIMNPFDLGLGGRGHYIANVESLAADPEAAVLIVFGTPVPQMQRPEQHAQLALAAVGAAARHTDLPVLYLTPADLFDDERRILAEAALPVCRSTLDAVAVAKALLPIAVAEDLPTQRLTVDGSEDGSLSAGALSEYRSKVLLREHGMTFPSEVLVASCDDALEAASNLRYPVVLKASGSGIWHKTEHGLVELCIANETELRGAWQRLQSRLGSTAKAQSEGVLVSPYIDDGIDVIVGFVRDPEFGPICVLGPGGKFAEFFGAERMTHLPLPLTDEIVEASLRAGPLSTLLNGYRGEPPYDRRALIRYVVEASRVVERLGSNLRALDLNPVRVRPLGKGAMALDALCVFGSGVAS